MKNAPRRPALQTALALSLMVAVAVPAASSQGLAFSATDSPAVQADVDRAKLIAGDNPNLQQTLSLCLDRQAYRGYLTGMQNAKQVAQFKAFDQLYYFGMKDVGSWALVTSDGIIQFDALDNTEEAQRVIVGGYKKFGLDPARMKYLIITHYHGDHSGGAKYLQDTFHPHVVLSADDWDALAKLPATGANGVANPVPLAHDMVATDGEKLTLGNETVTLWITPGHTPGPISSIFPVTDKGQPHVVSFLGGTAFPGAMESILQSRHSLERFTRISEDAHADVVLSNHAWFDNSFEGNETDKMTQLSRRGPGAPNPFVVGQSELVRYMMVNLACEQAAEDRLKESSAAK